MPLMMASMSLSFVVEHLATNLLDWPSRLASRAASNFLLDWVVNRLLRKFWVASLLSRSLCAAAGPC